MIDWYVGQRVVCINDKTEETEPGPYVVRGRIYTIRQILMEMDWNRGEETPTFILEELPINPVANWGLGYDADHFRPLRDDEVEVDEKIERIVPRKEPV